MVRSSARRRHAWTALRTFGSRDHRNAVLRGTPLWRAHPVIDSPRAIATHDPDVAARAERIVTLDDGRVLSDEKLA